jgi:7-cyano-7-deazaguanine synthase
MTTLDMVLGTAGVNASEGYVVLLSGGLDSTVLTYALVRYGCTVKALTVLYGQRHRREQEAARAIAGALEIEHQVVDLASLRSILGSTCALVNDEITVPEGHYEDQSMQATVVPNRNMLLLSIATAWSVALGLQGVAYAAHSGDHAIYPDCRPAFAEAMDCAIGLCDYRRPRLLRPFVSLRKTDIVRLGHGLGVPFERTWSCYNGRTLHCAKCGTCVERMEAFRIAGISDPTAYEAAGSIQLSGTPPLTS